MRKSRGFSAPALFYGMGWLAMGIAVLGNPCLFLVALVVAEDGLGQLFGDERLDNIPLNAESGAGHDLFFVGNSSGHNHRG